MMTVTVNCDCDKIIILSVSSARCRDDTDGVSANITMVCGLRVYSVWATNGNLQTSSIESSRPENWNDPTPRTRFLAGAR